MFQLRRLCLFVLAGAFLTSPLRAADTDKFLPEDTSILINVNVRQILDSALVKKHVLEQIKTMIQGNAQAQQILKALGLDPLKDFNTVTVASNEKASQGQGLVIVNGTFDLAKIQGAIVEFAKGAGDKLKIHKEGSLQVYEGKGDGDKPFFAAFADKDTLLLSTEKSSVIDSAARANGTKKVEFKKELRELLAKVDGKQSVTVAALVPEDAKKGLAQNPQTANLAKSLQAITGHINVTTAVSLDISIHTADAKSAEELKNLLDLIKGFAAGAVQEQPQFGKVAAEFITGLKVSNDKNSVTLSGKLTEEQIGSLFKK